MIVVGIAMYASAQPEWLVGFERLDLPPDTAVMRVAYQPVHLARNEIVAATLDRCPEATHLFFLDDDVIVPPDGVSQLLRASAERDAAIVTGLCTQRGGALMPCVYHEAANGTYANIVRFGDELQEIDACGAACLLIRTDVLAEMRRREIVPFEWDGYGEDLTFCRRVRALGYPIALDPTVQCTHLGVLDATYERFAREELPGLTFGTEELARLSNEIRPWIRPWTARTGGLGT